VFLAKLSASRWLIVEVARMYWASGIKPAAHTWSPSSILKGRSDTSGSSSEALSSTVAGKGPVQQAFTLASSFFKVLLSSLASFRHLMQHLDEHWDISTFPVFQSTSGLCSCNQVCPKIRFWLLRPVMQNRALSECLLYRRMSSATSVIAPAVLAVPSTFRTGIGVESFLVGIWFDLTS
jgi:hypothetical protein